MKRILITGASGFIGMHLCQILDEEGYKLYAILRSENSYRPELQRLKSLIPIYCDLRNIKNLLCLMSDISVDTVIHLAWQGVSGNDRSNYRMQLENVECTMNLITVAKKLGCNRFVGIGSTAEFDAYNASIRDGFCPNLVSIYGTAKLAAHFISKSICNTYGIEHIWGILGNTYGRGDCSNNFINYCTKLLMHGGEAKFTTGEQFYDFIYVTDAVRALAKLTEYGKDKYSYYIGSGEPKRLKEYITMIRDIVNPKMEVSLGTIPHNGISSDADSFSIEKLVADTGYVPKVPFKDGIKRTIEWLGEV